MKPNNEAYKEFMRVYNKTHVSLEAQIMASLTAAYAAQFKSEDYAGLVKDLRAFDEERLNAQPHSCEQTAKHAADAIEAVLAERDALMAVNAEFSVVFKERDDAIAERDALTVRLQAAANRLEKLAGDIRPPNSVTPQLFMLANSMKQNVKQSDRNAPLAPVEDKELVKIAANAIFKETGERVGLWPSTVAAAIAAIRPHIEAAERERCAKVADDCDKSTHPANVAAAIRSGK